jgi:hypothetical protein
VIKTLSRYAAWRWFLYLFAILPAMVYEAFTEGCRALKVNFDVWCVLVQQHEAGWRRRLEAERANKAVKVAAPGFQNYGPVTVRFMPTVTAATDSATTESTQ